MLWFCHVWVWVVCGKLFRLLFFFLFFFLTKHTSEPLEASFQGEGGWGVGVWGGGGWREGGGGGRGMGESDSLDSEYETIIHTP